MQSLADNKFCGSFERKKVRNSHFIVVSTTLFLCKNYIFSCKWPHKSSSWSCSRLICFQVLSCKTQLARSQEIGTLMFQYIFLANICISTLSVADVKYRILLDWEIPDSDFFLFSISSA